MDRGHFIISVYYLACHHFGKIVSDRRLRRYGFEPALSKGRPSVFNTA